MNLHELATLGVTALAGLVAAVIVFLTMGSATLSNLSPTYVGLNAALLFCCLGCLAVMGVQAQAEAEPRLVATFTVVGGSVAAVLLWSVAGQPLGVIMYAAAGVGGAGVVAAAFVADLISMTTLYKLTALLSCSLFVFGFVYLGVLTLRSQNSRYIVPLVVAASLFLTVVITLRSQLSTVT